MCPRHAEADRSNARRGSEGCVRRGRGNAQLLVVVGDNASTSHSTTCHRTGYWPGSWLGGGCRGAARIYACTTLAIPRLMRSPRSTSLSRRRRVQRRDGLAESFFPEGFEGREVEGAAVNRVPDLDNHSDLRASHLEWTGWLQATAGLYTFESTSDDGSWVFVNDCLVLDNGGRTRPRPGARRSGLTRVGIDSGSDTRIPAAIGFCGCASSETGYYFDPFRPGLLLPKLGRLHKTSYPRRVCRIVIGCRDRRRSNRRMDCWSGETRGGPGL